MLCSQANCKYNALYALNELSFCGTHFRMQYNKINKTNHKSVKILGEADSLTKYMLNLSINKKEHEKKQPSKTVDIPVNDYTDVLCILNKHFKDVFSIESVLGVGAFGEVYKLKKDNKFYALKIAYRKAGTNLKTLKQAMNTIHSEYTFCNITMQSKGTNINLSKVVNIDRKIGYGFKNNEYCFIILEYYYETLTSRIERTRRNDMFIKSVGTQLLKIFEYIHGFRSIYNDLKPDNIMLREKDSDEVVLIDFGLISLYKDLRNNHVRYVKKNTDSIMGNVLYSGIDNIEKYPSSRRSDVESIFFILADMYFEGANFLNVALDNENKIIEDKKKYYKSDKFNQLPNFLQEFLKEIKGCEFEDKPNYDKLKTILK